MSAWHDSDQWQALLDGTGCAICQTGRPFGVLTETPTTWIASRENVVCRGYVCVVSKRHVVEMHELTDIERTGFFADVAVVARAIDELFHPVKLNYEIHGNTIPHFHLHLFPRYAGDPFEGGPVRGGEHHALHSAEDLTRMQRTITAALGT